MDPTYVHGQKRDKINDYPTPYIIWLIVGVLLLVMSLAMARSHQLSGWQASVFRWVNNGPDALRTPALLFTEGLGAIYPIILCVLIPSIVKRFRLAWRFLAVVGATGVLMEIVKLVAKEPRPAALLHGNLHLRAQEGGLTSFPSGHEAVATAMALTLWLILPVRWRWISVFWILVMAVSRIYLGVHQPIDIVGGFAIGLIVVCAARLLPPVLQRLLRLYYARDDLLEKYS